MFCRKCGTKFMPTPSQEKHHIYICRSCDNARRRAAQDSRGGRERTYRMAHQAEIAERSKVYRETHRNEIVARRKEYANTHRTEESIRQKTYYKANQEKVAARKKRYRKANAPKERVRWHNRRARRLQREGTHTLAEWHALCDWFGNMCLCCGTTDNVSVDHVIPLDKGGTNFIANLQPLCPRCNRSKYTKTTDYRDPVRLAAFLEQL